MMRLARLLLGLGMVLGATQAVAGPPAQKLPSALVVLPFIKGIPNTQDTRIELLNLTDQAIDLQCFYVSGDAPDHSCNEIGFFLSMTPFQPVSWLASKGFSDVTTFSRVPPFFGEGELKCAVVAQRPEVEFHNALQGRAIVFDSTGHTIGYSGIAFRRLVDGDYTGSIPLDGVTYEQCPDKLHFTLLAEQSGVSESQVVLVPCTEDLLNQVPTQPNVQFTIINEFEQAFSSATKFKCFKRLSLTDISGTLDRSILGSDTAHLIVRGSSFSLVGLAIDDFTFGSAHLTSGNDPSFGGGRSATVTFP
jgi:hypothetical protein